MGPGSAASGPGSAASGPGSAASGPGSAASGPGSAAIGPGSAAIGPGSAAIGPGSAAIRPGSAAIGYAHQSHIWDLGAAVGRARWSTALLRGRALSVLTALPLPDVRSMGGETLLKDRLRASVCHRETVENSSDPRETAESKASEPAGFEPRYGRLVDPG
jgi:hypothetical protein